MKKYNIAYIGGHKSVGYPVGIQNGIRNAIEEQGHNLITIADLLPFKFLEDSRYYFRFAFELASRLDVDAYIVPLGIINNYNRAGKESDSHNFARMLDPKKTIILEDVMEGYRYVTKDNKPGMSDLMKHLIEEHGYKKICFISGPERSYGARERESVYFAEMEAHNLPVEDKMFARGSFSGDCEDVIEKLISDNPDVEAIACGNDNIAISVYKVMKKRGLTPGVDIAVTGFDDDPLAIHANPPLSTVRISPYDVAYQATYEAVRLCEGKPQEKNIIGSKFVHRSSCGINEDNRDKDNPYKRILTADEPDLDEFSDLFLKDIVNSSSEEILNRCKKSIANVVARIPDILDEDSEIGFEHFIETKDIVELFGYDNENYVSYTKFRDTINECILIMQQIVSKERAFWLMGEQVYVQRIVGDCILDEYRKKEWSVVQRNWNITQIVSDSLMYSDEPQKAIKAMLEIAKDMGIGECYVFEFPEPVEINKGSIAMNDRVYLTGCINKDEIIVKDKENAYDLHDIVSEFIPRELPAGQWGMVNAGYTIGGLLCGYEMVGIMVLEPCMLQSSEIVRFYYQLAFGLKHLQMIKQEKELISILNTNNLALSEASEHDELTGLYNRRGFMHALERKLNELSKKSRRGNEICAALYFMDLDGLKHINDTYGHEEGDFAITSTADILKDAFEDDLIGRLGGDEYLGFCVLKDTEEDDGSWMIQHINEIMDDFNGYANKPFQLAISVGYKSFVISDETWHSVSNLMDEADDMLYDNKRARKAKRGELPR